MNTREVYGYCRVSGKGQLDGDGFTRQEGAINAFAESKGWTVKRIFYEKGVSGTIEISDREAFSEMLDLCGGLLPQTVIVERSDRLARDLIVGELLFRECKAAGVEVFAADSGEELVNADSDPTRVLIRQVLGALAQWEKSALVKKLRVARERIRAQTGRCEGSKPLSETDPEKFEVVMPWIEEARARGDTYRMIALQLNSSAVKSPTGGKWHASTVHHLHTAHLRTL